MSIREKAGIACMGLAAGCAGAAIVLGFWPAVFGAVALFLAGLAIIEDGQEARAREACARRHQRAVREARLALMSYRAPGQTPWLMDCDECDWSGFDRARAR